MLTSESMKCKKLFGENTQREKAKFKTLNYNSERRRGRGDTVTYIIVVKDGMQRKGRCRCC